MKSKRSLFAGLSMAAVIMVVAPLVHSRVAPPVVPMASSVGIAKSESSADRESQLAEIIQDVTAADGYRYGAKDSAGNGMDTAKIIDNPAGGYLAIYHTRNVVKLATSNDLITWHFKTNLDSKGTQGTIEATSDGGFVVADEAGDGDGGHVRVMHYENLQDLYRGRPDKMFKAPLTLSKCNEGTPSIYSIKLDPDINHSVIELGMHFHQNCDTDMEAVARLTNFREWKATPQTDTDRALVRAASVGGKKVGGNIGDRDVISYGDFEYSIHEVQYVKDNFGTWRTFLYNFDTGRAERLNIKTHKGSTSFANPTFTEIKSPEGDPAIVVTMFLPGQGNAEGEGGELIYYKRLR